MLNQGFLRPLNPDVSKFLEENWLRENMANSFFRFGKKFVRGFFVFLLVLHASTTWSQVLSPRIRVVNRGIPDDLKVETASVSVRIVSFLAEITSTLTFRNPYSDALVGEFKFQLPFGATITGYALDIQGKMVDGVIVEKQRARDVFQREVSKRIDPGYIEMQDGNTFSTRIFPLPPFGIRTISIKYIIEPEISKSSLLFRVPIEFNGSNQIPSFHFSVFKPVGKMAISIDGYPYIGRKIIPGKFDALTEVMCEKNSKEVQLSFSLESHVDPIIEKSEAGKYYFAALDYEPSRRRIPRKHRPSIKHLNILWDASASRRDSEIPLEMKFLQRLIGTLNEDKLLVRVWSFRNIVASPKDFFIRRGDSRELMRFLESIQYDGATNLGALSGLRSRILSNSPTILFTDGNGTIGFPEIPIIGVPCFTFAPPGSPFRDRLSAISGCNGGLCFSTDEPPETVIQDIQCRLSNVPMNDMRSNPAFRELISMVLRGRIPGTVSFGIWEPFQLAEKVEGKSKRVSSGDNRDGISSLNSFSETLTGGLLRKYWASLKIRKLLPFSAITRNEIVSLSDTHGIVSCFTSLMVLETVEQYLEHRIRPPKTLPEMRLMYDRKIRFENLHKSEGGNKEIPGIQALKFLFLRLKLNSLQAQPWKRSLAFPGPGAVRGTLDPVSLTILSLFGKWGSLDCPGGRESFFSPRPSTRMSWAFVVAQCLADVEVIFEKGFGNGFVTKSDLQLLEKLTVEFADELAILGVKVTSLEDDMEVVRIGSEIDADRGSSPLKTAQGSPIPNPPLSKIGGRELRNTPSIFRKGRYFQIAGEETQPMPFYSDCSAFFFRSGDPEFAIQVLSNYLELSPFDPGLSRAIFREVIRSNSVDHLERVLKNELQFLSPQEILGIWLDSQLPIRNLILSCRFGSLVCSFIGLIKNDPISFVQVLIKLLWGPINDPFPSGRETDLCQILKKQSPGRLTVIADSDCGPHHFEIAIFRSESGRRASNRLLSATLARQTFLYLWEGTFRKCSVENPEPGDYEVMLVSNGFQEFKFPANVRVAIQFEAFAKKLEFREFRLTMSGDPELKRVTTVSLKTGNKDKNVITKNGE